MHDEQPPSLQTSYNALWQEKWSDGEEGPEVGTFNAVWEEGFGVESGGGGTAQGDFTLFDSESVVPPSGAKGLIGQSMLQLIVQKGATPPVTVIAGGKGCVPWCITGDGGYPCQGPFLSWGWLVRVRFAWVARWFTTL